MPKWHHSKWWNEGYIFKLSKELTEWVQKDTDYVSLYRNAKIWRWYTQVQFLLSQVPGAQIHPSRTVTLSRAETRLSSPVVLSPARCLARSTHWMNMCWMNEWMNGRTNEWTNKWNGSSQEESPPLAFRNGENTVLSLHSLMRGTSFVKKHHRLPRLREARSKSGGSVLLRNWIHATRILPQILKTFQWSEVPRPMSRCGTGLVIEEPGPYSATIPSMDAAI